MGKVVDITNKLDFNTNPKLVIKGQEFEVKADAETVLKIMGVLGEGSGPKEVITMYELLFGEKERKRITALKLQFKDFSTVVEKAINLVMDNDEEESQGE